MEGEKTNSNCLGEIEKVLAQSRERLRSACPRHDTDKALEVFDACSENIRERIAKSINDYEEKIKQFQKLQTESKQAKKKSKSDGDQFKKLVAENKSLREENSGLKRSMKGIKEFSRMSEEKRASILSMPKKIKTDARGAVAPSSAASDRNLKSKQGGSGRSTASPAAAPTSILSFQASINSGLSSLNSLVASIQSSSASRSADTAGAVAVAVTVAGEGVTRSKNKNASGEASTASNKRKKPASSAAIEAAAESADFDDSGKGHGESTGEGEGATKRARNSSRRGVPFPLLKEAFQRYKEIYGHMVIMKSFIVPCDDAWPEKLWGLQLGKVSTYIRCESGYKERREELEEMGFDFEVRCAKYEWDAVRAALQTYKNLNGNYQAPFTFAVPHGDRQWPEETWGIKLGCLISAIRSKGRHKEHHEELRAMGFDLKKQRNRTCGKKPKI
jgi:hypothetical protein